MELRLTSSNWWDWSLKRIQQVFLVGMQEVVLQLLTLLAVKARYAADIQLGNSPSIVFFLATWSYTCHLSRWLKGRSNMFLWTYHPCLTSLWATLVAAHWKPWTLAYFACQMLIKFNASSIWDFYKHHCDVTKVNKFKFKYTRSSSNRARTEVQG